MSVDRARLRASAGTPMLGSSAPSPGREGTSMMYGPDMMIWSVWHSTIFVIFAALVLYPIGRILRRFGMVVGWTISR
jgi:hypothetical protein